MNSEYYFEATDIIEIIFRNIRKKTTLCFLKKIFLLFFAGIYSISFLSIISRINYIDSTIDFCSK